MKIHTRILELSMILISHFIVLDLIPKLSIAHICKCPISSVMQRNAEWSNKTVLPSNSQNKKNLSPRKIKIVMFYPILRLVKITF